MALAVIAPSPCLVLARAAASTYVRKRGSLLARTTSLAERCPLSCDGIKYKTCDQDEFNQRTMAPTEIPPAARNLHDEPASEQPAVATAARHSAAATVINPYLKKKPQHDLIPETVQRGNTSSAKKPQHKLTTSVRTACRAAIANPFCPSSY